MAPPVAVTYKARLTALDPLQVPVLLIDTPVFMMLAVELVSVAFTIKEVNAVVLATFV